MLKQGIKDIYFACNAWLVKPNTWWRTVTYAGSRDLILHLGCGDDYRKGMINVDANIARKKDLWLDLRNPLPFRDGSAKLIYCCHVLEHLFPYDAIALLKEMKRVLSATGVIRLAVPSFERCLAIASGEDKSEWPRKFENSRAQAINYLFCDGQHKYGYCFENLEVFCREAGFARVINYSVEFGVTPKEYCGIELGNEPPGSLVVELYNE